MVTILTKEKTRLRVKQVDLPITQDKILGTGIDIVTLPDGHLCCAKCSDHRFECWVYLDNHRLEMGCMKCNESYRLLFPLDVPLSPFRNTGRYTCRQHPEAGSILIKNMETVCIGCEKCFREVRIQLKTFTNLVLADG